MMPPHFQHQEAPLPPGLEGFAGQLDNFRKVDAQREELFRHLFQENIKLRNELRERITDFENEIQSRRFWQDKARQTDVELRTHNSNSNLKPFVLALIDGDGVIFNDSLLQGGKDGGSEAASKLKSEIKNYTMHKFDTNGDFDVVVNIYVNLSGLGSKLSACGVIDNPTELRSWMNAFSINQSLFNFIDVGDGKERADHKLKEMLRLFVDNNQCKHIIFGGCHDAGYLTFLDTYKMSDRASKLSLLETVAEPHIIQQFKALGLPTVGFPTVFRNTALQRKPSNPVIPVMVSPVTSPGASNSLLSQNWAKVSGGGDYEGKVLGVAPPPKSNNNNVKKRIYLNGDSYRVDVALPQADRTAMGRLNAYIKEHGKLCNDYHLAGSCHNPTTCTFFHGPRLTGKEQVALRVKARNRLCYYGGECNNPDCFFGHMCPNDVCTYDNCYFMDYHGLDKTPKMARDDQGQVEIL